MKIFVFLLLLAPAAFAIADEPVLISSPLARPPASPYAHLNLSPEQLLAAQDLESAQYRFVQWSQFAFPGRIRAIDSQITVAEAQLASLIRRDAEFSRFDVWTRGGNPLFETLEDVRVGIVGASEALANLRRERGDLLQQQPIEYRMLQMEVERARMRLRLAR